MTAHADPALLLADLVNLHDHQVRALQTLSNTAHAYFDGGAADELTLQANLSAWSQLPLLPRVLRPLAGSHSRVTLLGRELAHPILLAPVAYQKLAHPDGEIATALAASAQQAGLVLSTQASTRLEDVALAAGSATQRGPLWFQLYLQADRAITLDLVRRAEAAGYEALVLTVDAPVQGPRDRERRAPFVLPPGIRAINLPPAPAQPPSLAELLAQAATWDDVAWLQNQTRLPLLLKGILHPQDAQQAAALGVAGVIVSNHGGRTLDSAPATATQLPAIRAAVGPDFTLLVDGGIRRGTDVLKAIALGANAVLVGRPYIHGLANAGAWGVAHVLRLLQDELAIAQALTGCRTLAEAGPQLLHP